MSGTDKFAHLAGLSPQHRHEPVSSGGSSLPAECETIARLVGAEVRRNRYGEHLFFRQWYASPEMCTPDADALALLLPHTLREMPGLMDCARDPEQWLFLDTETTGLAGGTGTYPFLVGLAWWDAHGLQVEQLFMRDLNEEHSVLMELAERMKQRPVLLTFNGKTFDWPLLETRYRMTRAIAASAPRLHIDLLHPARQLWRLRLGSVRLTELERHVLGGDAGLLKWMRHDDIDSALIPQMYFSYLRGGPAEPLAGVFRHNQMDLRGLAALAGKMLALLKDAGTDPASTDQQDPLDMYGLSRLVARGGKRARARQLCETALRGGLPQPVARVAKHQLAQLAKRERDYVRATSLWEELRLLPTTAACGRKTMPGEDAHKVLESAIEAAEQLAIYYEHRAKQPARAAEVTRAALAELRGSGTIAWMDSFRARTLETRLERRLARLARRAMTGASSRLLDTDPLPA